MRVRSIMRAVTVRVPPEMDCREAYGLLRATAEPYALVETESRILGLVGVEELQPHTASAGSKVGTLVRGTPGVVSPDNSIIHARDLMREHNHSHLLVQVDSETIATVSSSDIAKTLELLLEQRILNGLTTNDAARILEIATVRELATGDVVHVEGETPTELFVVTEGLMTVHTRQAGRIARIHPGEMVGAMEVFGEANSATVRAAEPSRLLVIDRERLVSFLAEEPEIASIVYSNISRLLSSRLRKANQYMFLRGIARHRLLVVKVFAVIGLATVLFTVGFGVASESPRFCTSCHYMQPYYDSWAVSSHSDVRCVECHYAYGVNGVVRGKITGLAMVTRYLTRTYDPKPEAEVSDSSCTRSGCHAEPSSIQTTRKWHNVRFTHAAHADSTQFGARLLCTSCHQHGRDRAHFSVSASTCYLCHLMGQPSDRLEETCRTCHFFTSDRTQVSQVDHSVLPTRMSCLDCHGSVLAKDGHSQESRCYSCHLEPRSLPTRELHRVHLEQREVACSECHSEISHEGRQGLMLSRDCDNCHPDQHEVQEQVYLGQGGREALQTPGIMSYFHVECTGCHRTDAATTAPRLPGTEAHREGAGGDQICLNCHPVEYQDKLRMWQTTTEQSLVLTLDALERVGTELTSPTSQASSEARARANELYEDASHNIRVVQADRSRGVHNFKYTGELLRVAQEKLEQALDLLRG